VAENVLSPADLIWPMFVTEGRGKRIPVECPCGRRPPQRRLV